MILIIGASGFIGSYLFENFKKAGYSVQGTSYKNQKPELIYFNLENMNLSDLILKEKPTHIIFLAATNATIDASKELWEDCYKINAEKIKKGIQFCFENNITPVYISTDFVFDGKKGNYNEEDKTNPINCYGKIKQDVETFLLNSTKPYIILRIGRVFGLYTNSLITSIIKKLKENQKSNFVINQRFTPIYLKDLFYFIKFLIEHKQQGIFHLASCPPTTHYEIAKKIKAYYHLDSEITPCTFESLNLLEKRPELIDLNINKIKSLTGFKEKPIEFFLEKITSSKPQRV